MARRPKPRRLSDEERSVLEHAAMRADKGFSRKFSAEPRVKPSAEPAAGESVAEVIVQQGGLAEIKVLYWNGSNPLHAGCTRGGRIEQATRGGAVGLRTALSDSLP